MAYLAKGIGERVTYDLQIIHLKNLILNSTNYKEEFTREILNARKQEIMKPGTSRVCENYNKLKDIIQRKLPNFNAKEDDKIEIAENIAEDMKNLLPAFRKDKDTINLIKINTSEFHRSTAQK
ncbi:hypothetical protein NPIL_509281 [Nephila pilipes]|uniref:Uncharacterized protein n=1 Tax=Nephila pilipes TaxID=299642 RepID=A0A8X6TD01_NEPPI|nr:hypothetical protein NPIL_509281 [Nephila pilipes]